MSYLFFCFGRRKTAGHPEQNIGGLFDSALFLFQSPTIPYAVCLQRLFYVVDYLSKCLLLCWSKSGSLGGKQIGWGVCEVFYVFSMLTGWRMSFSLQWTHQRINRLPSSRLTVILVPPSIKTSFSIVCYVNFNPRPSIPYCNTTQHHTTEPVLV